MIAVRSPRRSGITLTEILIAIMIMAVGLISLATLFPLGLLRLQEASRLSRAGLTVRTAADDVDTRSLILKQTFLDTWYGVRDPFVQDCFPNSSYYDSTTLVGLGVIASGNLNMPQNNVNWGNTGAAADGYSVGSLTSGLPFCYDPLWRAVTGVAPNVPTKNDGYNQVNDGTYGYYKVKTLLHDYHYDCQPSYLNPITPSNEARFGSAMFGGLTSAPYIHDGGDTNADSDGSPTSAHGLQRLTNFVPFSYAETVANTYRTANYGFTYTNPATKADGSPLFAPQPPDVAGNVFTSVDDIVFHEVGSNVRQFPFSTDQSTTPFSSLIPFIDPDSKTTQADYRFTWFFTGRQVDANGNGAQFTGEIVVCDGRPFSFDPLPGSTTLFSPAGETVVEAIYGYNNNTRAVLLRWRNTLADPRVRVGGWIADTTYERNVPLYRSRSSGPNPPFTSTPFARCYWYQVNKRTDPAPDLNYPTTHRSMVVTLSSPVRVVTPSTGTVGIPIHQNVALIMPSVINVFPRSFEVH